MTSEASIQPPRQTQRQLETDLLDLDQQIADLRAVRSQTTYRLEQCISERERLARHLSLLQKAEV